MDADEMVTLCGHQVPWSVVADAMGCPRPMTRAAELLRGLGAPYATAAEAAQAEADTWEPAEAPAVRSAA